MRRHQYEALRRVGRIRRAAQAILLDATNRQFQEVALTSLRVGERAIGMVKHAGSLSAEATLKSLDQVLTVASRQIEARALTAVDFSLDLALATTVQELQAWNTVTPRQLLVLSQNFRADFRPDLRSEAYTEWIQRIPAEALAPELALRDGLAAAVAEGRGTKAAVDRFLEGATFDKTIPTAGQILRTDVTLTNLPKLRPYMRQGVLTEQKISPLKRALRVMRTEIGRVDNVTGITFAETAGFSRFVNIGVEDNRQSEICFAACQEKPMTIAEWAASGYQVAPRHPWCRCAMCGAPDDF